jgi:hypothetical protein
MINLHFFFLREKGGGLILEERRIRGRPVIVVPMRLVLDMN